MLRIALVPIVPTSPTNVQMDVTLAVLESRAGRAARDAIQSLFESKQADIIQRRNALSGRKTEIASALPSEEKLLNESRWYADRHELKVLGERYNRELDKETKQRAYPILDEAMKHVPEIAALFGAQAVYNADEACAASTAPAARSHSLCVPWRRDTDPAGALSDAEWQKPRIDVTALLLEALDR